MWTIPLTISSTIYGGTTTLTGTLTSAGGGIGFSSIAKGFEDTLIAAKCEISVGSISPTGAMISVQECYVPPELVSNIRSANIGISVLPGIAKDSLGNSSSESNGVDIN